MLRFYLLICPLTPYFYALAIPLAFASSIGAFAIYFLVAIIWLIPDPRIERNMRDGLE